MYIPIEREGKRDNLGFKDNSVYAYIYCMYVCLLYGEREMGFK